MLRVFGEDRAEKGFTLIELITISAIIGILSSIAIPQFSSYRTKSHDAAAKADLRNAATVQEAYFVDHGTYCNTVGTLTDTLYGLHLSDKVNLNITVATVDSYEMIAYHTSGKISYTLSGPGGGITP